MRRRWILAAAAMLALAGGVGAAAQTLDAVKQRGQLICGVSQGFAGFSAPDSRGAYQGFDVDYCRALAAAVLGDAAKVRFVPLTAQARFTALQSGEIDVLYRNSTQTFLRDTTLGLEQGPVNFYDGQGFLVRRDAQVSRLQELEGASICLAQGTTHELNLTDIARARGITFRPVVFERVDTMYPAFFSGRCDAMTQDTSALAGALVAAPNPRDYVVMEERISKEPLGPFTRSGDEAWSDIVEWVHMALVAAEELGITQANAAENAERSQDPEVQRLLGRSGGFGQRIGLEDGWALAAIRAAGNYGEIFARNLGDKSPLGLERGLNALWTEGGLMYALPFR